MKQMIKIITIALVAFVMLGCTNNGDTNTPKLETIAVSHVKGTADVVRDVKKAVIFDFGILDIMSALKVDVEVAVPSGNLPEYLNAYAESTKVGSLKEPDLEAIFAFEPDVIIISARQQAFYDQLNEIAPTIYVELGASTYMEDFEKNAHILGQVFDKENEVEKNIASVKTLVEEVKQLASQSEDKGLIILTNDGSISAYGSGSRFGLIHDVLGVKQADDSIEVSTHGQEVNFEYIAAMNPDILYVVDRTAAVGGTTYASTTLDNELVKATKAAMTGRIVMLDPDAWYLSSGGISSTTKMMEEVKASFK